MAQFRVPDPHEANTLDSGASREHLIRYLQQYASFEVQIYLPVPLLREDHRLVRLFAIKLLVVKCLANLR